MAASSSPSAGTAARTGSAKVLLSRARTRGHARRESGHPCVKGLPVLGAPGGEAHQQQREQRLGEGAVVGVAICATRRDRVGEQPVGGVDIALVVEQEAGRGDRGRQ